MTTNANANRTLELVGILDDMPTLRSSETPEESGVHAIDDLAPRTDREPSTLRGPSAWLVGAEAYAALTARVAS